MSTVYLFGNPDLTYDSLPLRLAPELKQTFPTIEFVTLDPNEDWDVPRDMLIIDTVVGITEPCVFTDLSVFVRAPRVSCHDYDAYANLLLLTKLGKLEQVRIFGIPPAHSIEVATSWLKAELSALLSKNH